MSNTKNWFIRRKEGQIKGPFPSGQVEQYLLLGRFVISDEVSLDKVEWRKISSIPQLIPEILVTAKYDELGQQKLASKKRWADERRGLSSDKPGVERRHVETKDANRHDSNETTIKKQKIFLAYTQIAIVLLLVSVVAYMSFQYMPDNVVSVSNCSTVPGPDINWTHCQKIGLRLNNVDMSESELSSVSFTGAYFSNVNFSNTNLAYSELSLTNLKKVDFKNSNLIGAVLRKSNLSNVDFSGSDLQYIDLTGSILRKTNFSKANLSNAIWVDGRKCAKNSIGSCK